MNFLANSLIIQVYPDMPQVIKLKNKLIFDKDFRNEFTTKWRTKAVKKAYQA